MTGRHPLGSAASVATVRSRAGAWITARAWAPGGPSLLPLGVAADADELARDMTGGVGREEHGYVADLVRVDPAAHRDVPQRVRLGLGERDPGLVGSPLHERAAARVVDQAGQDRVDPDAGRPELPREVLGQAHHALLARHVGR